MTASNEARTAPSLGDLRGAIWMLGAVASFSAMALAVRSLATLSVYQVLFLRSAVGLPMLVAAVFAVRGREGLRLFRSANLKLQGVRNAIHILGQLGWIYAIMVL